LCPKQWPVTSYGIMIHPDTELSLLETIGESEGSPAHITQRDLATRAGLSLGMTNSLLRRLAERGWVSLTRLSPKSMRYTLTPEGVGEIARRTSGYFRRAARNADKYREQIELFIVEAKREGTSTVVLTGTSEIDFLIEFVCERHGIFFVKTADHERAQSIGKRRGVLLLYAESDHAVVAPFPGSASLRDIINPAINPKVAQ
jgi:DNA-binding MarR family transcriptional regulator